MFACGAGQLSPLLTESIIAAIVVKSSAMPALQPI
jgi:hypothetical protein